MPIEPAPSLRSLSAPARQRLSAVTHLFMHRLFLLLFMLCMVLGAAAQMEAASKQVKDIAPQALRERLEQVHVIDVNEADNYAFAHIPGAKLLVYDAITADVLPPDKSSTLVFYCWSPECPAAGMAAETAASLGYTDVYCMQVGITGWQDAGLPTEP